MSSRQKKYFLDAFKPYYMLISDKKFVFLMLSYCFTTALIVPFFVSAPYIFSHVLHYPGNAVGVMTAMLLPIGILGFYVSLLFIETKYERFLITIGIVFIVIGCLQFLINTFTDHPSFKNVIVPLIFYQFGINVFYAKYNIVLTKFYGTVSISVAYSLIVVFAGFLCSIVSGLSAFLEHNNFMQTSLLMFFLS